MTTLAGKKPRRVNYPTSDGKPFAESDWHCAVMAALIRKLGKRYHADPNIYVSGNLLVYYEEGNKRKRVAPDVFVVIGAEKKLRRHFLAWEENRNLDAVIEVTSRKTHREDTKKKFELYRDVLKVRELFFFDLFAEYLIPRLQGHRLQDGDYVPIAAKDGRLFSDVLGLWLEPVGLDLVMTDPLAPIESLNPTERAACVERDVLDLLRVIRELRRKTDKLQWQ